MANVAERRPIAANFVNGQWTEGSATEVEIRSPGDLDHIAGLVRHADSREAIQAVRAARAALDGWLEAGLAARVAWLHTVVDWLEKSSTGLGDVIVRENGKLRHEAAAEVSATIADARYQLELLQATKPVSRRRSVRSPRTRLQIRREPLGVVLAVTPWNFPLATIARKIIPALALGNTVIVKPSELTPLTARSLFQAIEAANLPAGTAQLLHGSGDLGWLLADHAGIDGITFTGSSAVGRLLGELAGRRRIPVQLELGGKNALVILRDADMEAAVEAAVVGAYSCAGQWCTGTSRVIVERSVAGQVVEKLTSRITQLSVGSAADDATTMGPVISAHRRASISDAVYEAQGQGASLLAGGDVRDVVGGYRGHFFEPTLMVDVRPDSALAQDEVFGPVLIVLDAADADEALALANSTAYGLAMSVFTRDDRLAERFLSKMRAGLCHVNLPTFYREPHMPLSGWMDSGYGTPECGTFTVEAFTKVKAAYLA